SGCGLRAAGCGLRAAGCGLRAAGCGYYINSNHRIVKHFYDFFRILFHARFPRFGRYGMGVAVGRHMAQRRNKDAYLTRVPHSAVVR
ncbi:MAG: hypothetical protein LBK99_15365, partial [Opitutaceae bacterium]|nr:hypothetical protein [Opitutaceae bacterium]